MAISTTTDLNSLYNSIYNDALFVLREENLMVGGGLVTVMRGTGFASRIVPIWSQASVNIKPEGVDYVNPTSYQKTTKATFTPQVRMAQFLLTDEMISTESTINPMIQTQAQNELGGAVAEQVDVDLMTLFASFTATKGTANSALTIGMVGAGLAVLNAEKVRGSRYVVLHPYQWHDIWVLLATPQVNQAFLGEVANEALRRNYVATMINADWFVSGNVPIDANADATGGIFTREGLGYDEREPFAIEPERDASRKATELNASLGYAVGVLRQEAGVGIISDATEPS